MGVSRDALERIKSALDPLAVVREAVPSLKQSGSRWKGNCPFHNERTPSFYFQPDKGLWHCFGACQEGGDILKFVMKLEGLSFPEALRELARRTGVALDWDKT
ncbi:MAG TPA: CHC2 zinc finger domain-containing protein, partial [Elusimicrobiota bacterium]|nr:CHC2 zinc finger domain-containing protein [Elusimicrobiota bacterium]